MSLLYSTPLPESGLSHTIRSQILRNENRVALEVGDQVGGRSADVAEALLLGAETGVSELEVRKMGELRGRNRCAGCRAPR